MTLPPPPDIPARATRGMTPEKATALRKPFPKESVGQLPKGGTMLDYVGHAAVTDRLLTVDPEWTWEPFALGADGLPAVQGGNLWIRLTVCGVTRIGVGDGKNAKECIGDAIRNAAMRFGVALDLWAKENLVEFAQAAQSHQAPPAVRELIASEVAHAEAVSGPDDLIAGLEQQVEALGPEPTSAAGAAGKARAQSDIAAGKAKALRAMFAEFGRHKIPDAEQLPRVNAFLGTDYTSRGDITETHAKLVAADLKRRPVSA